MFDDPILGSTFIGLIYESLVIIIFGSLLILVGLRYRKNRTLYTRMMLALFLCFMFGIISSWLSKLLLIIWQIPSYDAVDPLSMSVFTFWLISIILQFRLSFAFMTIGAYVVFLLRLKIFTQKNNPVEIWIMRIFSAIVVGFSLIFVKQGQILWDLIAFGLAFLMMMVAFLPFTIASFQMRKKLHENIFRNAALSLGIMGITFVLILFCFFLDRLMMMLEIDPNGYTVFYFSAWGLAILGTISAYIGYILPGNQQKLKQELQNQEDREKS